MASKYEIHVICSRQPKTRSYEVISKIHVHRVGRITKYSAGANLFKVIDEIIFIKKAISTGSKLRPDLVDGSNLIAHFAAKRISEINNIPSVFWYPDVFIGNWVKTSGIFAGFAGYILERINLLKSADAFISISNITLQKLQNQGVPGKKIKTIHCGIEKSEFRGKVKKYVEPTILCISRLVKYKRLKDLILAHAMLTKKIKNIKLIIIGTGPEKKKLKQLVSMIKIKSSIKFMENLPRGDVVKIIKKSHIFSLPSEVEGFGIATIEAAAAGLPYVVSNIDVFKEVTRNGSGGFLFEVGSAKSLYSKLYKLLTDEDLYTQKSKQAIGLSDLYDWEKIANVTSSLYQNLIKNN